MVAGGLERKTSFLAEESESSGLPGSVEALHLRYCPLEPGELVDWEQCSRCPHRPEPPLTLCVVPRNGRRPRARGFWDAETR